MTCSDDSKRLWPRGKNSQEVRVRYPPPLRLQVQPRTSPRPLRGPLEAKSVSDAFCIFKNEPAHGERKKRRRRKQRSRYKYSSRHE
ncbi:hypothetical protein M407DRAFT_136191 [Tulasnella calospora MUT 4182]|uniref:Uncharacterized protein n=1 Tax=Tulasnella calospora MUT 4182 TaxID=1051891 RepID=A0A0C3QRK5_9AGAM|nr:hypothetical protein M407DRAFT_136191 [Tulasnella calospora MUT 4182]